MWREERALLTPGMDCAYGSLNTEVIFNNSLREEEQGALLVRLPIDQEWPGIFDLTIEAWHINKPRKIPQPKPPKPLKRTEPEKSIFASLLETISDTLTKTVENIEKQKLEDINDGEDGDKVSQTTITTTTTEKEVEVTTEAPETTSRYIGGGRRHEDNDVLDTSDEETTNANSTEEGSESIEGKKSNGDEIEADTTEDEENIEDEEKAEEEVFVDYSNDGDWTPLSPHGRLVVRMEKVAHIFAGDGWKSDSHETYTTRLDYSVKLVCAKNFTGPACSVAKICLGRVGQISQRMSCTKEGKILCQPGWRGSACQNPVCKAGCHSKNGFCLRVNVVADLVLVDLAARIASDCWVVSMAPVNSPTNASARKAGRDFSAQRLFVPRDVFPVRDPAPGPERMVRGELQAV